ncbi:MAG: hypothetical protein RLZZ502_1409, partial [Pseudomonadota bacterium]
MLMQISQEELNKIRWRARRGLLENDLIFERFFSKYDENLSPSDLAGLTELLDFSDNDLMDFILDRPSDKKNTLSSEARQV